MHCVQIALHSCYLVAEGSSDESVRCFSQSGREICQKQFLKLGGGIINAQEWIAFTQPKCGHALILAVPLTRASDIIILCWFGTRGAGAEVYKLASSVHNLLCSYGRAIRDECW